MVVTISLELIVFCELEGRSRFSWNVRFRNEANSLGEKLGRVSEGRESLITRAMRSNIRHAHSRRLLRLKQIMILSNIKQNWG